MLQSLDKHLHIVALDVPYPVDYGGVFDLFYKLVALKEQGIRIHLHCFEYGRGEQEELLKYCEKVYYYPRKEGHKGFSLSIPYIVASRNDATLWERLSKDNHPVLLEGVHCCYGLHAGLLKNRRVLLRLHNVEYEYYNHLCKWESSMVKKAYFKHESRLLKRFEKEIANLATIVTVSKKDEQVYRKQFLAKDTHFLPVFFPNQIVTSKEGQGTFVLYHGNLSVAENEKVAIWLIEKIFNDLEIPFVIAGKNPSERLKHLAHSKPYICLVENPQEAELNDLIQKAQVHLLPSFTNSGIKLKLLNALFNGRHVIANQEMIDGTGLEKGCQLANNPKEIKYHTYRLFHKNFSMQDITLREQLLATHFNNEEHAKKLISWLW